MYEYYNPHPSGRKIGDCVVRALTKALNKDWQDIYVDLCIEGYMSSDMPSANYIWGKYLIKNGYKRDVIPYNCPDCYTIEDFANEHPNGIYVLGTGTHAVAVCNGTICDAWDSSYEQPIYFYYKGE